MDGRNSLDAKNGPIMLESFFREEFLKGQAVKGIGPTVRRIVLSCVLTGLWAGLVTAQGAYGRSQTSGFERAILGSEQMSHSDKAFYKAVVPPKMENQFYALLGGGLGLSYLGSVRDSNDPTLKAVFSETQIVPFLQGGLGYLWTDCAVEARLIRANLHYSGRTIPIGLFYVDINELLYTKVLEVNTYILFDPFQAAHWIKPRAYVRAGAGYGYTRLHSGIESSGGGYYSAILVPTETRTTNSGFVFNGGAGLRTQFSKSIFLDTGFQLHFLPVPGMMEVGVVDLLSFYLKTKRYIIGSVGCSLGMTF
jgi:hypothetical protein